MAESNTLSLDVHLFETVENRQHIYRGKVILIDTPYFINERDSDGHMRKVVKFPLLAEHDVIHVEKAPKVAAPKKLSAEAIKAKALAASQHNRELAAQTTKKEERKVRAASRKVVSVVYDRDENIALYAKQRAKGICQLCEQPAPFHDQYGQPYLESHHIDWLSRGGLDTIENTIALCCNCHKKMHVVDDPKDVEKLKAKANESLT